MAKTQPWPGNSWAKSGVYTGVCMHQYNYLPLLQAHRAAAACPQIIDWPTADTMGRHSIIHSICTGSRAVTVALSSSAPLIRSHDVCRYINLCVCIGLRIDEWLSNRERPHPQLPRPPRARYDSVVCQFDPHNVGMTNSLCLQSANNSHSQLDECISCHIQIADRPARRADVHRPSIRIYM